MAAVATSTAPAETKRMSTEETGLEKASPKTPAVITTPEQYRDALQRWAQHYNVLTPFTSVSGIAPSFGLIASVVKLSPDKSAGEVYDGLPFLKGQKGTPSEELAPAKIGLRKLAECGGISTSTTRTDPRSMPHYWEFKAVASYRGLDGSTITREATFEWDLRDGSDRLKGWQPNQVTEGRKNGLRNCEARAINAAIRECGCGIKQKYTRAELEKPFVVVRVAFQPDMTDPDIKRMVTQQALGGVHSLYPAAARELPASQDVVDHEPVTEEPKTVGRGSTAKASDPAQPDPDQPPTPHSVRIMKIEEKSGEKNGRPWTKWTVIDSNGTEATTFSRSTKADADTFLKERAWVEIIVESSEDGKYRNIMDIVRAGQQPKLPELDAV